LGLILQNVAEWQPFSASVIVYCIRLIFNDIRQVAFAYCI